MNVEYCKEYQGWLEVVSLIGKLGSSGIISCLAFVTLSQKFVYMKFEQISR